jgi:hypothetical protein
VALGVGLWLASWVGGHPRAGAFMFAVMTAFAAVLLGGRSESMRGLRGDERDERWAMIDLRATALTGVARCAEVAARPGAYRSLPLMADVREGEELREATGHPGAVRGVCRRPAISSLRGEVSAADGLRRLLQPSSEGAS